MAMQTASVPNGDSALRAWRKTMEMTLVEAARLVLTSHSVWLRWETGERLPRGRSLQRLSRATGLTSDQILGLAPYDPSTDRAGANLHARPAGATRPGEETDRSSPGSLRKAG